METLSTSTLRGVRVHQYPSRPDAAREVVKGLLGDALQSIDQRRSIAVKKALRSLDPQMFVILQAFNDIPHPTLSTMRQLLSTMEHLGAIQRLLAGGMLEAVMKPLADDFMEHPVADLVCYRKTSFGIQVFSAARAEMGFSAAMTKWLTTDAGKAWLAEQGQGATSPKTG